jgi:hypothetical protein
MTKLFSMKTLAFAGAAAFALTLAAAPQADAKTTYVNELIGTVRATGNNIVVRDNVYSYAKWEDNTMIDYYEVGKDSNDFANSAVAVVSESAVTLTNGKAEYYYSAAKKDKDPTKWTTVSTDDFKKDENGNYVIVVPITELTKNKAVDLYFATDANGTGKTTKIVYNAAPKIKCTLTSTASGPSISVKQGSTELTTGYISLYSQYNGFSYYGIDLENGSENLTKMLQRAADFGGATFTVTYKSKDTDTDNTITPPATAKLKVSATPKAPTVGLKIAKAFTLKFKNTMEYRTFVKGESEPEKWDDGTNTALTLATLFGDKNVTKTDPDDYVLNDTMVIQARTAAKGTKTASKITTTTVYKSAATPSAVNVVIKTDTTTKKEVTTTGATIEFNTEGLSLTQNDAVSSSAVVALQYYDSTAKKWQDVKSTNKVVYKSGKVPDTLYVRVKGTDYKAAKGTTLASQYEAAGKVLTITLDKNDPANESKYNYNGTAATAGAIDAKPATTK